MDKLPDIKIGGRMIPLFYSTLEMVQIQEEIGCTAYQLNDEVFGIIREEDEEDPNKPAEVRFGVVNDGKKIRKMCTLLKILGNAGLEESGQEPDLTDKWILRHMKPGLIVIYAMALVAVIAEGNRIESTTNQEEQGPVDVVAEEQNAKKQSGN